MAKLQTVNSSHADYTPLRRMYYLTETGAVSSSSASWVAVTNGDITIAALDATDRGVFHFNVNFQQNMHRSSDMTSQDIFSRMSYSGDSHGSSVGLILHRPFIGMNSSGNHGANHIQHPMLNSFGPRDFGETTSRVFRLNHYVQSFF